MQKYAQNAEQKTEKPGYGAIADFDLTSIPKAWKKVTVNPLGSAITSGALLGLPTYFLAPWALKKFYRVMAPRLSPKARAEMAYELEHKMPSMRAKLGLAAGLLGAGASAWNNWNPKYPVASAMKWNYAPERSTDETDTT